MDKMLKSKVGIILEIKTLLCHGVFDIVHPGHIRHLSYAKVKPIFLVVSITTDKHVKKGKYRPHVPENLRALNLAAFDMVDFVYIIMKKNHLKLYQKLGRIILQKGMSMIYLQSLEMKQHLKKKMN